MPSPTGCSRSGRRTPEAWTTPSRMHIALPSIATRRTVFAAIPPSPATSRSRTRAPACSAAVCRMAASVWRRAAFVVFELQVQRELVLVAVVRGGCVGSALEHRRELEVAGCLVGATLLLETSAEREVGVRVDR